MSSRGKDKCSCHHENSRGRKLIRNYLLDVLSARWMCWRLFAQLSQLLLQRRSHCGDAPKLHRHHVLFSGIVTFESNPTYYFIISAQPKVVSVHTPARIASLPATVFA